MRAAGALTLAAVLVACSEPASAQRDPVDTDRLLQRIEAIDPRPDATLTRDFGLPEWNARVLAAAERHWLENGGRPGAESAEVVMATQLPSGFSFDRYDLDQTSERWTGRWLHMRRVEVTAAASRAFPLDAVRQAWERHGRNAAAPEFQRERDALLPNPDAVARSVLVRTEITDSDRCPALRNWGMQAQTVATLHPQGEEVAIPDGQSPFTLIVATAGGQSVMRGPQRSAAGHITAGLRTETSNCWRLESINNAERRWPYSP